MPGWVRKDDVNDAGAPVIGDYATTVFVNGKNAALKNSIVQGHSPGGVHASPVVAEGSSTVIVEGRLAAFKGASDNCGHTRVEASDDTFIPGG